MRSLRIACIQNNADADWEKNLLRLAGLMKRAIRRGARLITFPEAFVCRGPSSQYPFLAKALTPRLIRIFQLWAKESKTALLLGSLLEASSHPRQFYNSSYLISEMGKISAKYRKIHLFDISLKHSKKKVVTSESKHIAAGKRVVGGKACGLKMGLTVCYDLRFPELFRKLTGMGSRIIFVPANFTATTGEAHWEVLLRARAIENQVFIVAPAQSGLHPITQIKSFGNSMIVDPWGRVLRRASAKGEEVLIADLDLAGQAKLRRQFPVLIHRKFKE